MNASDLIRRLHQHRMWVNHRLQQAVEPLTDEQLHQPMAIGQGSVWKTLTHLLAAEFVWLEALLGNPRAVLPGDLPDKLPGNQLGAEAIGSRAQLLERWGELDQRWNAYLADLSDAALDELVNKASSRTPTAPPVATRRCDILLHVCTHAQYTTAQLVNMLRQLEQAPPPDVMLITLARQERANG